MYLSWRERLEASPVLKDINNWPSIDAMTLSEEKRKRFIRNKNIVSRVLSGEKLKDVSRDYKVSSPFISYLLKRCLAGFEHEEPNLTTGLIPDARVKKGQRAAELSENNSTGTRGSFQYILKNYPDVKQHLNKMIKAFVTDKSYGQNLTPKIVHSEFLRLLKERNWPNNQYPFDQVNLGRETCRKYFHRQVNKLQLPKVKKPKRIPIKKFPKYSYEEVEIDSQIMDISCNVVIDVNGHETTLRLSRMALFVAIDVSSNCILSYHLCLTKDPSQYDLICLLAKIHYKWEARDLKTPGASYEPGACLPSAISEEFRHVGIGVIKLDNALCHHANSIREFICDGLVSAINFGLPANPKSRNSVEYLFNLLNKYLHRFKSTTGSHHKDPKKESNKNYKNPPLLNLKNLEDFLSVVMTGHNVKSQSRLGGLTPIDVLKNQMNDFPLQLNFSRNDIYKNPFIICMEVKVYNYQYEKRAPIVHFSGLKYKGDELINIEFLDKKISVQIDIRDIRHIKAYTLDGKSIGVLSAPKSWQSQPLSLSTFRLIKRRVKREKLLSTDYLNSYFSHLLENKHIPKVATEIVKISRESQFKNPFIQIPKSNVASLTHKQPKLLKKDEIAKWNPGLFNNRLRSENRE